MNKGTIHAISISKERGQLKQAVSTVQVIKNHGIDGDGHAGDWGRQVSCLDWASVQKINQNSHLNMGPGDFAENLLIDGLDFSKLIVGSQLRLGQTVVLEVTQIGKEDHPSIVSRTFGTSLLPKEGIFCKVVEGGMLSTGDPVFNSSVVIPVVSTLFSEEIQSEEIHSEEIRQDILIKSREMIIDIMKQNHWHDEMVQVVMARPLTSGEAIGSPERQDYPLLKGKEVMIEATFRGYKGQAFTDQPGNFCGTLNEVVNLPLEDHFQRAVSIATINALLRSLGRLEKTVHCRDMEPGLCARRLVEYMQQRYGHPRIAFIGLQPGMVAELSKYFEMRVVDLDADNIGKRFNGVLVESVECTSEIIDWCEVVVATGSTSVNNSLDNFLVDKPTVFYGVTVSGIACLNGLKHYCAFGH